MYEFHLHEGRRHSTNQSGDFRRTILRISYPLPRKCRLRDQSPGHNSPPFQLMSAQKWVGYLEFPKMRNMKNQLWASMTHSCYAPWNILPTFRHVQGTSFQTHENISIIFPCGNRHVLFCSCPPSFDQYLLGIAWSCLLTRAQKPLVLVQRILCCSLTRRVLLNISLCQFKTYMFDG